MRTRFQSMGGDRSSQKKMFFVSVAIHVVLLGIFPFLLTSFGSDDPEEIEIVFYKPPAERPAPPPLPEPEPVPEPEPEPVVEPKPEPPKPKPIPPKPEPKPEPEPVIAQVQPRPEPKAAPPPPPKPKPKPRPVRTNVFTEARAETVAVKTPERKTRSAGFSQPEAEPAPAPRRSNHRAAARVGNFEVDTEPSNGAPPPTRDRAVTTSTFADDTVKQAPRDARRSTGTVQATSFTAEADPASVPATASRGSTSVSTGGFGDTVATTEAPRRERKKKSENPDQPVEIVAKPRPEYTAEARDLQVEGEVVLRVVFVANGELRVVDVVEGLGHGLDEAAVDAAKKIEFKPARRNGQPVDYSAVLRIVFQLA